MIYVKFIYSWGGPCSFLPSLLKILFFFSLSFFRVRTTMAGSSFSKLLIRRQLLARFRSSPPLFSSSSSTLLGAPQLREASTAPRVGGDGALVAPSRASHWIDSSRTLSRASFSSRASDIDESQAPAAIDYRWVDRMVLQVTFNLFSVSMLKC